ncbi:Putative ribonuclease H protein At1g65750 [Linum perenne]
MGLRIAWDHELRKVELQLDSTTSINLIEADNKPRHQHAMEVLDLRELLHHEWEVRLMHVYKEGNHDADFLAGIGFIHPLGATWSRLRMSVLGVF